MHRNSKKSGVNSPVSQLSSKLSAIGSAGTNTEFSFVETPIVIDVQF